jgi:hypothetical protein
MPHDVRDLDPVLARLVEALNVCGAASYLTGDGVADDGRPMLRARARLAGRPSEAELLKVLDAGRRVCARSASPPGSGPRYPVGTRMSSNSVSARLSPRRPQRDEPLARR